MRKLLLVFIFIPFFCFSQAKNKGLTVYYKGQPVYEVGSGSPAATPTCNDGIQNGDETGVDCGGSCDPCVSTPTLSIVATDDIAVENTSTGEFTITSNIAVSGNLVVAVDLTGEAVQGTDYSNIGTVTILDGQTSTTITITTIDNALEDGSRTVDATIGSSPNYDIGSPSSATVTIQDDDSTMAAWMSRNVATPSYVYTNPTFTPPSIVTTYTPTSSADVENPANADKIAIISNSFNCSGCTFASGQIIRPDGGTITGTNINLSDAYIEPNTEQAFSSSARFSNVYDKSRVYPELFGATANDATDDIDAIEAAILNVEFLITVANGEYITNRDRHAGQFSPLSRSGNFDWDMNNAKMTTTDNSTFRNTPTELTHQGYYVIALADFDLVSIHNGEFDGQDLANRFLDIYNIDNFNLNDLYVHNLLSEPNSIPRATAMNFSLFPNASGFQTGFITNCVIEDVRNPGDGISNNTNGIAKALSFSLRDNGVADVFINNNTFRDITGDDAEGIYSRNDGSYDNATAELYFHVKNNDLINCQRRGIKFDCSNAFIEGNLIESSAVVSGNQASMLQVFSIQSGTPVKNVYIHNNNIRILGNSENSFFGTNDSRDIIVDSNTFYADVLTVQRVLSFSNITGQQDALYDGDLSNVEFTNNNITNGLITILDKYYVLPGLNEIVFENNTQTFDGSISLGAYRGAININASSLSGSMRGDDEFRIKDHTITYNLSTMGSGVWIGVIGSNGTEPKNVVLDNVDITYTGSGSVGAIFGGVRNGSVVDYDNTNTIIDCDIIGASGTGALEFNGADTSVTITNSFGDGGTPITF